MGQTARRILHPLVWAAALACRDDAPSPTSPDSDPAPAVAAAVGALAFRQVSHGGGPTGGGHSCGVTTDGLAYCWGDNEHGQLGIGTSSGPEDCNGWSCSIRPVAVLGGLRFAQVSAGGNHSCGITTDERAYCWGFNTSGGRRFRQVRAGNGHTCAITPLDVAFCWGHNAKGQLGDGTSAKRLLPVRVAGDHRWRQVSAGAGHTCGVTTADRPYCWGNNANGRLGDGTTADRSKPAAVGGGRRFRQIDAGSRHTCAVQSADDRAYCWGDNGTNTPSLLPTPVAAPM